MMRKLMQIFIALLGILVGYELALVGVPLLTTLLRVTLGASVFVSLLVVGGMAGGIIFYLIAPSIIRRLTRLMEWAESRLQRMPTTDIVAGIAGLLAGLLIANLLSLPFGRLPVVGPFIPVLANVLLGYIGMNVAVKKKEELWGFLISIHFAAAKKIKRQQSIPWRSIGRLR